MKKKTINMSADISFCNPDEKLSALVKAAAELIYNGMEKIPKGTPGNAKVLVTVEYIRRLGIAMEM